jgi:hypothetical protein
LKNANEKILFFQHSNLVIVGNILVW